MWHRTEHSRSFMVCRFRLFGGVIMRMLLTFGGGASHLYPLVPLSWAFRAAGHEVLLAGSPRSAEIMKGTGHPIVTFGGVPRLPRAVSQDGMPWPADWPAHPASLDSHQLEHLA